MKSAFFLFQKRFQFLFLDNDFAPRLLGRAGFFEQNMIIFEEKKRRSGVVNVAAKKARSISQIIDTF